MARNVEETERENQFIDKTVSVNRVTKVTKGGKRFAFSAFVVTGDRQGRIGIGLGKSREVSAAIAKATSRARKAMFDVPLRGRTIPYPVIGRHGSSQVILRSAYKGTGVIAGGPVRAVMEALGVQDIMAKSVGSANKQNVVKATLNALAKLRSAQHIAKLRGQTVKQMVRGEDDAAK